MKSFSLYLLFLATLFISGTSSAQEKWVQANGDAIEFGRPGAMIALPGGRLFFGCDKYKPGLFRSEDFGQSFKRVGGNDWYYSLVADGNGTLYAGGHVGLTRSTNNGDKWTSVTAVRTKINALAAGSDGTVYAATGPSVHRTTDGGETWGAADLPSCVALMVTPKAVYAGTLFGFFRSTDKGASWVLIPSISQYPIDVLSRAGNTLFACGIGGMFISTDGTSWMPSYALQKTVYALSTDSSGSVYAATNDGIYRSTDQGKTWKHQSGEGATFRPFTSCIASDGGANLYVGVGSSDFSYIARSSNRGDTWPPPPDRGIAVAEVYHLFVDKDNALYASTDRGLYRTRNKGNAWEHVASQLDDGFLMCSATSDGTLYGIGEYRGPYRSTDRGKTWTVQDKGLPPDTINGRTFRMIRGFAATDDGSLFVLDSRDAHKGTGGNLYRSRDKGESWDSVSTLRNFFNGRGIFRNLIAHGNYLFIGVEGNRYQGVDTFAVYYSSDFGVNWTPCGQPTWKYSAIVHFDPYTGYLMAGRLRSTDNGDSWIERGAEMPDGPFVAGPGFLYATSKVINQGFIAFTSTDDGETWTTLKIDSFPDSHYNFASMALDSSGTVFGGIYGKGVYRRLGSPLSVKKEPVSREPHIEVVRDYVMIEHAGGLVEIHDVLGRRHLCPTVRTSTGWQVDVRTCTPGLYYATTEGYSKGFLVRR